MNILFLTTGGFPSIYSHGIYTDLLRTFMNHGHAVYIISSRERRTNLKTEMIQEGHACNLCVEIGNLTKTNLIEKGISTVLIEEQYKQALKKYFSRIKFDLVMYSTPPITLAGVVEYVKKRDHAATYLLLKDIFPQNSVDMGMLSPTGPKAPLYWYFRQKEKDLYKLSDHIGCMSPANVAYVIAHNPQVDPAIVEVCPNSIELVDLRIDLASREAIRTKYQVPLDQTVFIYGGNLGKPQGIPFLMRCLKSQMKNPHAYFLIVGDGTEYTKLEAFFRKYEPTNMQLLKRLPKEDYDTLVAACNVGMIFLDHRFTIPNFPSRLLSYLQAGLPVLTCTDPNTDMGQIVSEGGFGWACESNDVKAFHRIVKEACRRNRGYCYSQSNGQNSSHSNSRNNSTNNSNSHSDSNDDRCCNDQNSSRSNSNDGSNVDNCRVGHYDDYKNASPSGYNDGLRNDRKEGSCNDPSDDLKAMGERGFRFLEEEYGVEKAYRAITKWMN